MYSHILNEPPPQSVPGNTSVGSHPTMNKKPLSRRRHHNHHHQSFIVPLHHTRRRQVLPPRHLRLKRALHCRPWRCRVVYIERERHRTGHAEQHVKHRLGRLDHMPPRAVCVGRTRRSSRGQVRRAVFSSTDCIGIGVPWGCMGGASGNGAHGNQ